MLRTLVILALALTPACSCGDGGSSAPDAGGNGSDGGVSPDADPGSPDAGMSAVITCPDPVPATQSGICDVSGSGGAILMHGTVLGNGTVYENGYVLVEGDAITCVGCDCDEEGAAAGARTITCDSAVISPGLINPHDHMRFNEAGAPIDHGATRYDHRHGWRGTLSTPQNPHGTGQTSTGMRWSELRHVMAGTTSMVGSGRALGMVRNLDDLETAESSRGLRTVDFETFSLGDSNETFRANCTWRYATDELRVSQEPAFLPHVAEGIDDYAAEEFRCQSTSFDGGEDFTEKNTAHIHSIGLSAADYYRMALDDAQLIWSPRSNISLYGTTAQVGIFDRMGGTIALGTDWSYSGSANILRELACAADWSRDYLDGHFDDEALWKMVTINAARVTSSRDLLGSLEVGKLADIAIFRAAAGEHHAAVVGADNADVALVLKSGVALVGEADTVASLGETCEAVQVCGAAHAVCASREFGATYDSIKSAATGGYPDIFCGVPAGEPTCVPSRPGEYTGARSSGDLDGDGIDDATDNCQRVFNPIRPIDSGVQPDADNDGMGDPCDPNPLLADLDNDTIDNDPDNCPFDSNTDQADGDNDGKGDICDPCPTVANPDGVCGAQPPPDVTIVDIQMGSVPVGTSVALRGVIVTSVFGSGVTVQDPAASSPAYSGLYIFTGGSAGANVGDRVDVTGDVEEYFENTELENATVTVLGAGTPIAPASVTIADAASEAYEGVLVRITDIATIDDPYNCSADVASCADTDLWQLNGPGASVLAYDRAYRDADWTSHSADTPVAGVMMYRFERRRIMPRTAADFGP